MGRFFFHRFTSLSSLRSELPNGGVIKKFAQHEKSKRLRSCTGVPGRVLKSMKLGISRIKWDTWTTLVTVISTTRKTLEGGRVPQHDFYKCKRTKIVENKVKEIHSYIITAKLNYLETIIKRFITKNRINCILMLDLVSNCPTCGVH